LQRTTGTWTPFGIHTTLPSLGLGVACVGCFIQHPACGVSSYPTTGLLMSSQLYAMNPLVDPAFANSNVNVTITWLMLAAVSLLRAGPLAAPGVRFNGRTRTPVKLAPADVAAAGAPPAFCPAAGRGEVCRRPCR
jgi:hypothetical protein